MPKYLTSGYFDWINVAASMDGSLATRQENKVWGEQRFPAGASPLPTTFRYTGQRESSSLGLYFYGARWYDTALGRFAQANSVIPLASQGVQAWDRYGYANNNPVRYNDPSGKCIDPDSCPNIYLEDNSPSTSTPTPPLLTPTPTSLRIVNASTSIPTSTSSVTPLPAITSTSTPVLTPTPTPTIFDPSMIAKQYPNVYSGQSLDELIVKALDEYVSNFSLIDQNPDPLLPHGFDHYTPVEKLAEELSVQIKNPLPVIIAKTGRIVFTLYATGRDLCKELIIPNEFYPLFDQSVPYPDY